MTRNKLFQNETINWFTLKHNLISDTEILLYLSENL